MICDYTGATTKCQNLKFQLFKPLPQKLNSFLFNLGSLEYVYVRENPPQQYSFLGTAMLHLLIILNNYLLNILIIVLKQRPLAQHWDPKRVQCILQVYVENIFRIFKIQIFYIVHKSLYLFSKRCSFQIYDYCCLGGQCGFLLRLWMHSLAFMAFIVTKPLFMINIKAAQLC